MPTATVHAGANAHLARTLAFNGTTTLHTLAYTMVRFWIAVGEDPRLSGTSLSEDAPTQTWRIQCQRATRYALPHGTGLLAYDSRRYGDAAEEFAARFAAACRRRQCPACQWEGYDAQQILGGCPQCGHGR